MNRNKLFKRSAISPVIATLLLILIAIAAGTTLYAYVSGFIGNSTQNSGFAQSMISLDSICASKSSGCNGGAFYVVIRNLGGSTLSYQSGANTAELYFTDSANSATTAASCDISTSIAPGSSITAPVGLTCPTLPTFTGFNSGDNIVVKVVMPDGGTASGSTRMLG
ncbi:MAG: archaellin/type IV pilin N-terminal domain-containing protein [Nitrososphaerales archaeon]